MYVLFHTFDSSGNNFTSLKPLAQVRRARRASSDEYTRNIIIVILCFYFGCNVFYRLVSASTRGNGMHILFMYNIRERKAEGDFEGKLFSVRRRQTSCIPVW